MINKHHYQLLAGEPKPWDTEFMARVRTGGTMHGVAADQRARGHRSASPHWEMKRKLWIVRDRIAYRTLFLVSTLEEAFDKGITWANRDPKKREFFATKQQVQDARKP